MYSSPLPPLLPLIGLYPAPASSPQRATVQPLAVPCNAPGAGGRARGWRCPSWGRCCPGGVPIAPLHAPSSPLRAEPCILRLFCRGHSQRHPKATGLHPLLKQSVLASECGSPSPLGYHGPGEGGGTGARQRSPSAHCTAPQQSGSLWLDCPRQGSPLAMSMPENSLYFFSRQPSVLVILLRPGAQHVVPCPRPPPLPPRERRPPALPNMHIYKYIYMCAHIYLCVCVCVSLRTGRADAPARLQPATEQIRAEMGKPLS